MPALEKRLPCRQQATAHLDKSIETWVVAGDRLVKAQAVLVELAGQPISEKNTMVMAAEDGS